MEFWTSLLIEKSWNLLQKLSREFEFILIGGWAVYFWTKVSKSKDIDIIIEDWKVLDNLKKSYKIMKNERLRRYEMKVDDVDVDIYLPFIRN